MVKNQMLMMRNVNFFPSLRLSRGDVTITVDWNGQLDLGENAVKAVELVTKKYPTNVKK